MKFLMATEDVEENWLLQNISVSFRGFRGYLSRLEIKPHVGLENAMPSLDFRWCRMPPRPCRDQRQAAQAGDDIEHAGHPVQLSESG